MEAADRDAVVTEFRDGVTKILIATDVLSRGFDVSQVRGLCKGGVISKGVGGCGRLVRGDDEMRVDDERMR